MRKSFDTKKLMAEFFNRRYAVTISNVAFDATWIDVKEAFKKNVDGIIYVEMHKNEQGKAKGNEIVPFWPLALSKM